jgi:hypothetical protein
MFVEAKAHKAGTTPEIIQAQTNPAAFHHRLMALHAEYMAAECSFGYMAEQLGVSYFALTDILNALGLRATQGD